MPFEYHLVPNAENGRFDEEAMDSMRAFLDQFPHCIWQDGAYVLFRTDDDRDRRVPKLLAQQGNSYLDPIVSVQPDSVFISSVADPATDKYLHGFVTYCQARWPCDLWYGTEQVSPDDLLMQPGEA